MHIGSAYYSGEDFKTADSAFATLKESESSAYLWIAEHIQMDPDTKLGLAKPKFERVVEVVKLTQ